MRRQVPASGPGAGLIRIMISIGDGTSGHRASVSSRAVKRRDLFARSRCLFPPRIENVRSPWCWYLLPSAHALIPFFMLPCVSSFERFFWFFFFWRIARGVDRLARFTMMIFYATTWPRRIVPSPTCACLHLSQAVDPKLKQSIKHPQAEPSSSAGATAAAGRSDAGGRGGRRADSQVAGHRSGSEGGYVAHGWSCCLVEDGIVVRCSLP